MNTIKLYYDFLKSLRKRYFSRKNTEPPVVELPEKMEVSPDGSYEPPKEHNCYAGFLRAYEERIVQPGDVIYVWEDNYRFIGLVPTNSSHRPSAKLVSLDGDEERIFSPESGRGWDFHWKKLPPKEAERMITKLQEALAGQP